MAESTTSSQTAYIALGGNLGDVADSMESALARLHETEGVSVTSVSHVYETQPVGPVTDRVFLNAAAQLETVLSPLDLLAVLKATEQDMGRMSGDRWDERVIDLDLLLYNETRLKRPELMIPHPHLWYRRFVLDPLADIATDFIHPVLKEPIGRLLERLQTRPIVICAMDADVVESISRQGTSESEVLLVDTQINPDLYITRSSEPNIDINERFRVTHRGREIDLALLPGTLDEQIEGVLTSLLDEPVRQSRPLRRMP